jgi:hypothetical protein
MIAHTTGNDPGYGWVCSDVLVAELLDGYRGRLGEVRGSRHAGRDGPMDPQSWCNLVSWMGWV